MAKLFAAFIVSLLYITAVVCIKPDFPKEPLNIQIPREHREQRWETGQIVSFYINGSTNGNWKMVPLLKVSAGFCTLRAVAGMIDSEYCGIESRQVVGTSEPYWVLYGWSAAKNDQFFCSALCINTAPVQVVTPTTLFRPDCVKEGQDCQATCRTRGFSSYTLDCQSPGPKEHGTCACL